eukprot:gene3870-7084_t
MSFLWGDWWEFLDEESGRSYYFNEATQESVWVKPVEPVKEKPKPTEKPVLPKRVETKIEPKKEEEPKDLEKKNSFKRPVSNSILEKQNTFAELLAKQQQMSQKSNNENKITSPKNNQTQSGTGQNRVSQSIAERQKSIHSQNSPFKQQNEQNRTSTTSDGNGGKVDVSKRISQGILDRQKSIHSQNSPYSSPYTKQKPIVSNETRTSDADEQKSPEKSPEQKDGSTGRAKVAKLSVLLQNQGPFGMPGGKPYKKPKEQETDSEISSIVSPKQQTNSDQMSVQVDPNTGRKSPKSLGVVLDKPKTISPRKQQQNDPSSNTQKDSSQITQKEAPGVKREKKKTLGNLGRMTMGRNGSAIETKTPLVFEIKEDDQFSRDITKRLQSTIKFDHEGVDSDSRKSSGSSQGTDSIFNEQAKKRNSTKSGKRLTSNISDQDLSFVTETTSNTSSPATKTLPKGFKYDPKQMGKRDSLSNTDMIPVLKNKESDHSQARCIIKNSGKNTLITYAKEKFQKQKSGLFGKEVKPEKIVQWQKQPLKSSLHSLSENDEKICLGIYEDLQKVIISVRTEFGILIKVLDQMLSNSAIRNEIILYGCKFINKNPDPDAQLKSVLLLTAMLSTVTPKEIELIEAIDSFLSTLGSSIEDKTLKKCIHFARVRFSRSLFVGSRKTVSKEKCLSTIFKGEIPLPLYGVPLEEYFEWQNSRLPDFEGVYILDVLSEHLIQTKGIHVEGIFRLPGDSEKIEDFKDNFGMGNFVLKDVGISETHVVGSLYKLWLRELAEPLVPLQYYTSCLKAAGEDNQEECVNLLYQFPPQNIHVIESVINFLACICNEEFFNKTKMNVENISVKSINHRSKNDDDELFT